MSTRPAYLAKHRAAKSKPRRDPGATLAAQRRTVKYTGHKWRLVRDSGNWLFIERGRSQPYGCWVPVGCVK